MNSTLTDQTVLVTGGAGFIGSHIAETLVADNRVRILDDLSSGHERHVPAGARLLEGDLRDPETLAAAMRGVDCVFHHAAMVSVTESIDRPAACQETNAAATLALLERARREDARVVTASSAAIYGAPESVPVAETEPPSPQSPYGISKLSLDLYTRRYADLYDLPTVTLRYFNVYGPRQGGEYSGVIDCFLQQARAGDPITVEGDGEQTRDFVHVSDVVEANLRAATTDATGEAFNVATGDSVSILELAELVGDVTGSDSEIVHVDPRPGDIRHSRADVGKARDRLGFESTVSLRDGLADLAGDAATGGSDVNLNE